MATQLELTTTVMPEATTKGLDSVRVLKSGDPLKLELGEDELDVDIPEGETWTVHAIIEVFVT